MTKIIWYFLQVHAPDQLWPLQHMFPSPPSQCFHQLHLTTKFHLNFSSSFVFLFAAQISNIHSLCCPKKHGTSSLLRSVCMRTCVWLSFCLACLCGYWNIRGKWRLVSVIWILAFGCSIVLQLKKGIRGKFWLKRLHF